MRVAEKRLALVLGCAGEFVEESGVVAGKWEKEGKILLRR